MERGTIPPTLRSLWTRENDRTHEFSDEYTHVVVQQISRTFSSFQTGTLYSSHSSLFVLPQPTGLSVNSTTLGAS